MMTRKCKSCDIWVELEKKILRLDNGQVVVIYEGECPICGRQFYEDS